MRQRKQPTGHVNSVVFEGMAADAAQQVGQSEAFAATRAGLASGMCIVFVCG